MDKRTQAIIDKWYSEYIKNTGSAPTWKELCDKVKEVQKER